MEATPSDIENILNLLTETPKRLEAVRSKLTEDQLTLRLDEKTWSVNDILAHLRACTDVWGSTIARMLHEDTPTYRHLSPRTYLKKTDYPQRPFAESFDVFKTQRQELLTTLNNLAFEEWSRDAIVKNGQKERQWTVFLEARRMALHEAGHCDQIEALLTEF